MVIILQYIYIAALHTIYKYNAYTYTLCTRSGDGVYVCAILHIRRLLHILDILRTCSAMLAMLCILARDMHYYYMCLLAIYAL